MAPQGGAPAPKGNRHLTGRYGAGMRTHTYSIAVAHLRSGDWTVAIVMKVLRDGAVIKEDLVYGPVWLSEHKLQTEVARQLEILKEHVRDGEERQA